MKIERIRSWQYMKYNGWISFILILISILLQSHMFHQSHPINPDPAIFQSWLYSHDEDSNALMVYKPASFDYPIGWPRPGMKFEKNGSLVIYDYAPNDQQVQVHGTWKPLRKGIIEITFPYGEMDNYQIEIKELEPKILKIKKL